MTLGLPPLRLPALSAEERRSLDLWLHAAVERIGREARASAMFGPEVESRQRGARRLCELLAETLTPPAPPVP